MSSIKIYTKEALFNTTPGFYGLLFEDISRSENGELHPEMLHNRASKDSIPPKCCEPLKGAYGFVTPEGWRDQFNNGEGSERWLEGIEKTPVPAWYVHGASMELNVEDRLDAGRLAALGLTFEPGGSVTDTDFQGLSLVQGRSHDLYLLVKGRVELSVNLESTGCHVYARESLDIDAPGYTRSDLSPCPGQTDPDARFMLSSDSGGTLMIGLIPLMPRDTHKGYGMRKDLMGMLESIHSRLLRFPGGYIMEGFTKETTIYFPHMIGPVRKRPSHNLMWHYRTTNGLGYHGYLQICEDLDLEPAYVVNCDLTYQGRKPEFFKGKELEQWIRETFDTIDYAIAPARSRWGRLRAQAGHPEPFKLAYLEIGNENDREVYFSRYEKFYRAIHQYYSRLKLISDAHTEKLGLPIQIVGEHLYSMADTFVTTVKKYCDYRKNGSETFIGGYAVANGLDIGNLKLILAETMYPMDAERSQDIIRLTAYAPLFQNVDYTAWYPNLVAFSNHACYGTPFYHALSMLSESYGQGLLCTRSDVKNGYPESEGPNGLTAYQEGTRVRNVKVDGRPAGLSHGTIGSVTHHEDGPLELTSDYTDQLESYPNMGRIPSHTTFVTFREGEASHCTYDLEILLLSPDQEADVAIWAHSTPVLFSRDETDPFYVSWNPVYADRYVWSIKQGQGRFASVNRFNYSYFGSTNPLPIRCGEYNHFQVVIGHEGFDYYLDDLLIQTIEVVPYPMIAEPASEDDTHIYIRIVDLDGTHKAVEICLDCGIQTIYEVELLTGCPEGTNSLEEPLKVSPVTRTFDNGADMSTYQAPAYSFSVPRLKKTISREVS